MSLVTLLSDLGLHDASVASVKGVLMKHLPDVQIVDVAHQVEPYSLLQSAYLLTVAQRSFPKGTVHIVLVDLFYDSRCRMLLAEIDGQYIIAPDHGLLPLAYPKLEQAWQCFEMDDDGSLHKWVAAAADVIAGIGKQSPEAAGMQQVAITHAPTVLKPMVNDDSIEGRVMYVDRFQNVVLNITREEFEQAAQGRKFYILAARKDPITEISRHYNSVKHGQRLCRFNSSGYLELAINKGNAAQAFGLNVEPGERLFFTTIKIMFNDSTHSADDLQRGSSAGIFTIV